VTKLTPEVLLLAYAQGIFPMADEDGQVYWYSPDPRAIFPLDGLHVSSSLKRVIRSGWFEVRVDTAFVQVMRACAESKPGRETTWISEELVVAYTRLHRLGFAHSVEVWRSGLLVGCLYGVTLRGLFAGESMFSRERDASKVALVYLVHRLQERGFTLLDTQILTPHLKGLGAIEVPAAAYQQLLADALQVPARFAD
jgi:leucyl/phenylalanyl-tRNA--protein transferase